ncbi:hypothetical protein J2X82_004896 [Priestia megaterium]|nr:hypothetical protein [Priestia megaterium]
MFISIHFHYFMVIKGILLLVVLKTTRMMDIPCRSNFSLLL